VPLKERRLNFGNKWDFAPAPEDSKNYVIAPQHELFINGKFVAPTLGKYFESINPATEQTLTTIAAANAEDVNSAVKAARKAYEKVWSKMPGRERGKYLYRIARIIQEKSRELAVLETMDGGKTIKESRDVDLPLVAAHFFYYAGWADKLKYAFPGKRRSRSVSRGRSFLGIFRCSWRRGKSRPRSRAATPSCSSPPKPRASRRCGWRRFFRKRNCRRRGEHRHRRGRDRRGARQSSGHQQARFHRKHGGRQAHCTGGRRHKKETYARTRRQGGEHLFEDAPIDQAIEGVINGIYFNQGHVCCAGSRLFVQEGIYSKVIKKLRDRIQTLRVGNPLDKNTDIGAIIRGRSSKKSASWCKAAWTKARS